MFEVTSLDHWIMQSEEIKEEQSVSIKFKECPRCKKHIKKTSRYQTSINSVMIDINNVKKKMDENNKKVLKVIKDIAE